MYICKANRTSRTKKLLAIKQRHSQIKINKAVFVILYSLLPVLVFSLPALQTVSPKKASQEKSNFGHF